MIASNLLSEVGSMTRFGDRFFREGFWPRYEVQQLLY
jgi:hypothetical protein